MTLKQWLANGNWRKKLNLLRRFKLWSGSWLPLSQKTKIFWIVRGFMGNGPGFRERCESMKVIEAAIEQLDDAATFLSNIAISTN